MKFYLKFKRIFFIAFFIAAFFSLQSFSIASSAVDQTVETIKKDTFHFCKTEYILSEEQKQLIPNYAYYNRKADKYRVIGIERTPTETYVDYIIVPTVSASWTAISKNTFLRDQKTGDMYKVRRLEKDIPLEQILVITNRENRYVCFTLVFPPLPPSVKVVDFIEESSRKVNGQEVRWRDRDLKVKKYEKIRMSAPKIIE